MSEWQARDDRPASAPVARIRIADARRRLHEEPAWRSGSRNAITLVKEPGIRVVLTALRKDATLAEHRAPGPLTLHLLSGAVRVGAAGQALDLEPGDVVALSPGMAHDVQARVDSVFLLTIALTATEER
jgi:quercetin dioxygenase-like cupin family protein